MYTKKLNLEKVIFNFWEPHGHLIEKMLPKMIQMGKTHLWIAFETLKFAFRHPLDLDN